jgi:hypothetical protein
LRGAQSRNDVINRAPSCEVRRQVTGSPDTPLHANSFAGFATQEKIQTIADFFPTQHFSAAAPALCPPLPHPGEFERRDVRPRI